MITSNSRRTILDRLRVRSIESPKHPTIDPQKTVKYENPLAKFTEILTWVGGRVHQIDSLREVQPALEKLPEFNAAKWIASAIPQAIQGNFNLDQVDDPHSLASIDWSIGRLVDPARRVLRCGKRRNLVSGKGPQRKSAAVDCAAPGLSGGFFLDFSGKGEVRFRSFDLGTGRWIFAGIRSCVQ